MHSTVIIRHYRKVRPDCVIIFGVSERFAPDFATLKSLPDGPHIIVGLPHGPAFPDDGPIRVAWTRYAATLPNVVKVLTPSVHPYGWAQVASHNRLGTRMGGSLVDAIFHNAGIKDKDLAVPRRPVLPVDIADYAWSDQFQAKHNLIGKFVTMEYISYSMPGHDLNWYADVVRQIRYPVVALAGLGDPLLPGAIDARGCTYRQAKVLIMRSKCFVGCASGNGLLASSEGCETPMVEVVEPHISHKACGYMNSRPYQITGFNRSTSDIAVITNSMVI